VALEHLEAGTISLLDLAIHDYLNLKANLIMGNGFSLPAGVCMTSAVAIHATCPSQISERAVQRSLERLEKIGWIKTWKVRGKRGNYPVLVCRASVHDLSGKEHRVNGEKTTDWRKPVYAVVCEVSAVPSKADAKLSGYREVRSEREKEKKQPPALIAGKSSFWKESGISSEKLPGPFVAMCDDLCATRNGQSLNDFMGACMDAWELQGQKIPALFARAAKATRENPGSQQAPAVKFLPEIPFQKRDWTMEDVCKS
jgi:hypothetical protein